MRNFYELSGNYFLNISTYMEQWTKKLDLKLQNGDYNKTKLQSLGSMSQNLWNSFNLERDQTKQILKDKHYMESPAGLQAYSASFLLPNIERVFALLVRDENNVALKNLFSTQKEELIIADFGSGPLSASIGFICALEYLFHAYPDLLPPKKIKIFAIERSERIFQFGLEILQNSFIDEHNLSIERVTSIEKIPTNIDFALCSNVFNEIPLKHRLVTLNRIYEKLNFNGSVLIIEPGQEIHAKELGKLRDDFLAKAEYCEIISPCSHKNLCPLSRSVERTDWCWFRHGWTQPEPLKEIEKFSKIDHHFLNFSYLFFIKSTHPLQEPFYARVVSDKLNVNLEKKSVQDYFLNNIYQGDKEELEYLSQNKNVLKVLLCTENGELKSTLFDENNEIDFKRGMRFVRQSSLNLIINERK